MWTLVWINLLCCSWYASARLIIVSESVNDSQSCFMNKDWAHCQSLVAVSKYGSDKLNNTIIRINDTNYTLQGVASFSGVENITITGKDRSLTHINCNNTNPLGAGIVFKHSSNIILSDFSLTNCAAYVNDKNILHLTDNATAILIYNSLSATITQLKVSCGRWRSLTILNTVGLVQVDHSEFTCNSSGGGANIILDNLLNDMRLSLVISNCNFTNNTASVIHSLIYTLKPPHYARGGGISIQLLNRTHSSTVLLQNVVAYGNTAVLGGGLYVFCGKGDNITVLDSNFTVNTASIAGGGAYVEFSDTTTYKNQTFIRFQRLLFDSNTAHEGGGLGIFFGGVNSIIEIMECKFYNNTGSSGNCCYRKPD